MLSTRLRAMRTANTELIALIWRIGRLILERQRTQPWGSAVIRRLVLDLRREFPDMTGLSATNLQYMRAFAAAWPTEPISPQAVGKLPWGHIRTLLDQLNDPTLRDWYADRDAVNGWSRQVLEHHIATGLHRGSAPHRATSSTISTRLTPTRPRRSSRIPTSSTSSTSPSGPANVPSRPP